MKRFLVWLLLVGLILPAGSCVEKFDAEQQVDGFAIVIREGSVGSADDPAPFPEAPVRYVIDVHALDLQGNWDRSYNGKVAVYSEPVGRLAAGQPSRITVENGAATGVEVLLEACHGELAIWVEDAGGLDASGSYAVGASPVLHFANPTIAQMQRTDDIESNALNGDFAEIRAADREIVVTGVHRNGFYCQDLAEPEGAYAGLYVYTHNSPSGVEAGSRLIALRGQVGEFFGFTELGFPDYLAEDTLPVPDPMLIDTTTRADDVAMEALESSLVEVQNVEVCSLDEQYSQYDQWRVLLDPEGSCNDATATILIAETRSIDFDPAPLVGETLTRVIGNLKYHYLAEPGWMIVPRQPDDIQ